MLELKRIHILGFKSFCDRTEISLDARGVTAIVGPNGCGKSNISDAISWVLGEQSAKSLRGVKMEDVIFAGTRDRKPTGMAEVTLVFSDPEVYQPAQAEPTGLEEAGHAFDWDEAAVRQDAARATEEAIAELQPGVVLEGEPEADDTTAADDGNEVVLKVRRRKFQRDHIRDGQVVISRRLFRTGESEYLLNGKLCRLRDIQDVLMGTGLGGECYGIIEQERIGQLLSSKPHDRRAIIEEAAGTTRFKTKKHLAELRLEQARQNLARVNDIFDEVTRQMNSLKRQAAKAERYGAMRDELRTRLRAVIATRLSLIDAASAAASGEIAQLSSTIGERTQAVASVDSQRGEKVAEGYARERESRDAAARANTASVELERTKTQLEASRDRSAELGTRLQSAGDELERARQELATAEAECSQLRVFRAQAEEISESAKKTVEARQDASRKAAAQLAEAEQRIETARGELLECLRQANEIRNRIAQAEAGLEALNSEVRTLEADRAQISEEREKVGLERGQMSLTFDSASAALEAIEAELTRLRSGLESGQAEETESRRQSDELRAEQATLQGRRNSLEALVREHGYSTDTVRKLLKAGAVEEGHAPVGVLADFIEVSGQHEAVVDEFLRDELNYIVVKNWNDAHEGMRVLKTGVEGRATFLVHPDDSQAKFSFAPGAATPLGEERDGIKRLKDVIRVLDGFGNSLETILPKLRNGYLAPDSEVARSLALENPEAFFLSPNGECFHNVTVTGGKPGVEGPLALKRELREAEQALAGVDASLAAAERKTSDLAHANAELTQRIETQSSERRKVEQEAAHTGAALRQMEAEAERLERRLAECSRKADAGRIACGQKTEALAQLQAEIEGHEQRKAALEAQLSDSQGSIDSLRTERSQAERELSEASAELAALEERRRGAASAAERMERTVQDLDRRVHQITEQIGSGEAERRQRATEQETLALRAQTLEAEREAALVQAEEAARQTEALRAQATEFEQQLQALRGELESLRDRRTEQTAAAARLASDLTHLEETCLQELSVEARDLRAEESIVRLEAEPLAVEEEACRAIRQKIDAMGPVNMMALDEYKEAADRQGFLDTQRKDLIDSIDNTLASIREIETVLRGKFEEAFAAINENFSKTFSHLFGGGQAFMKLTDEENIEQSGIDIIASPPGKKLQNVLLLSGGEKALTALSLLMAIFQFQPSPFCVLDEVDAALDESNVGRLANMLEAMSEHTHFIVITHSKRMMQAADALFGVTMQEPGVSKIVSVRLAGERVREKLTA